MRQTRAILFVGLWLVAQVCGWGVTPTSDFASKSSCCSAKAVRPACSAACCRRAPPLPDAPAPVPSSSHRSAHDGIPDSLPPVVLWELPHPTVCLVPADSGAPIRVSSDGALYLQLESLLI